MNQSMTYPAIFVGILAVSLSSCSQGKIGNSAQTTAISIGIAVAQTSNIALIGQEQVAGAKLAEKYFNDQGGVNGTPIKLVFQDAGKDEAGAINAFQNLITKNNVVGIIGPTTSQQAFSAAPIGDRAKIPVIGPSTIAKGIPEIGEYVSRVAADATVVAPNAVAAALKINPKLKKVAVLYAQDQEALVFEAKVFQQAIKQRKLDLVSLLKFQSTDTDFQTQATQTINSKPDLVIISGLTTDGGNLVKQIRELGYQGLIIGGNGLNTSNIFSVCKKMCDRILVAQAYSPNYNNKINNIFRNEYKNQYQKEPPQFSAQAFTAVQVLVEALKAVDQKTKINTLPLAQLRTALNQQVLRGKYETPLSQISFTPKGDIIQRDFYVAQIKMDSQGNNGKFEFLK
ncbi:amino acid/amide ABC transporter substrate-binding protein, HAAT family [Crinalium epipsammum PCC 9333]|uniref:Amino acid/amide ABC transporter substrate-binding protein, HAAT family n=2 Tax=Crinalium TaxID=241421 RepID=K9W4N2_9CYAN|nr:amino acid/amide ABC transporter substrate-binding protein, HAAT family [Crinalium epipsammum PCC 9333]